MNIIIQLYRQCLEGILCQQIMKSTVNNLLKFLLYESSIWLVTIIGM